MISFIGAGAVAPGPGADSLQILRLLAPGSGVGIDHESWPQRSGRLFKGH